MLAFLMSSREDLEQLLPDRDWFALVTDFSSVLQLLAMEMRLDMDRNVPVVQMDPMDAAGTFS